MRSDPGPTWRSVALPREHGGWGLTAEPILLGLLLAPSLAGLCLGLAAFGAFLARTPAKLVGVDLLRRQWQARSSLALRIAAVEVLAVAGLAVVALILAGPEWLVPVAPAVPLVAIELWYDVRSRSRRLVPELCGAVGVAAATAVIVVAGDGPLGLAFAAWAVLAARSVGSIPFVRSQIVLARRGVSATAASSDLAQAAAVAVAWAAITVDRSVWAGALMVTVTAIAQIRWSRRQPPAIKVIGFRQMGMGFAVVLATAASAVSS